MDLATVLLSSGDHGDWWPIFPILWFVLWVGVIATAIWFFAGRRRHWREWREGRGTDRAADILAERFARGELNNDEYTERLRQLRAAERQAKEERN
jgi:putative membrane protein